MDSPSDRRRTLWRAWRERRDPRAFERLVRPELAHVAAVARRCGARADEVEDAVQETLVQLAQETTDVPLRVGLRAWLCRRVVLRHKRTLRGLLRRRRHEAAAPPREPTDPTEDLAVRDRVHAALALLNGPEREALLLRYLQELDYREMSFVLGLSEGACRVRVHRGLERLRTRLGDRAVALLPLLGLPRLAGETILVGKALSSAGTTGGVAAALLGGTGAKVATAVLATAGALAVLAPRDEEPPPTPRGEPTREMANLGPRSSGGSVDLPREAIDTSGDAPPAMRADAPIADAPDSLREVLQEHLAGRADHTELFWDHDALAARMPAAPGEPLAVEGAPPVVDLDLEVLLAETSRLTLGPGTFRVVRGVPRGRTRTIEIQGAGVERTTLVAPQVSLWMATLGVDHLTVRDLTFESFERGARQSGELLDVRDAAVALVERVRFGNGYPWAGTGAPLSVRGRALLAFDACEFRGAWKQSGGGSALGSRGEVLASFRGCLFQDLDEVLNTPHAEASSRGLVHFQQCRFENAPLARRGTFAYPVRVRGAEIALGGDEPARVKTERFAPIPLTEATDLRFAAGFRRGTVGELVRLLERVREEPGERLVLLRKVAWPTWDTPGFVAMTLDLENQWHTRLHLVDPQTIAVRETETIEFPRSFDLELGVQEPDLRGWLGDRLRSLPEQTPCLGVHLRRRASDESLVLNTYPSGSFHLAR